MNRHMAHPADDRLAWVPGRGYIHDYDLDLRLGERVRLLLSYALVTALVIGFLLLVSLPGQS